MSNVFEGFYPMSKGICTVPTVKSGITLPCQVQMRSGFWIFHYLVKHFKHFLKELSNE